MCRLGESGSGCERSGLPVSAEHLGVGFRFLVKLQEFNYQLKVKALFDK